MMVKTTRVEEVLLARLKVADKRLAETKSLNDLRPALTMRRVKLDLVPRQISPSELKAIRAKYDVSQAVFAALIQVSTRTLQKWEQGVKPIDGAAAVLLGDMFRHPEHWSKQFGRLMKVDGAIVDSKAMAADR